MSADITQMLEHCHDGSQEALDALMPVVYGELRRAAAGILRRRPGEQTLHPTALVHEAYFALIEQDQRNWRNRGHFFALAAKLMRRILLRRAEQRHAIKRGGGALCVTLPELADGENPSRSLDMLHLDQVLQHLERMDPRKHRIVELRFFSGLTLEEIAALEESSERTVRREWSFARAWIHQKLQGTE